MDVMDVTDVTVAIYVRVHRGYENLVQIIDYDYMAA